MVLSQRKMRHDRIFVAALLIVEALFLYNYYVREVAWDVAENNDQAVFLERSYRIQDDILNKGLTALGRNLVSPAMRPGNGWIYPFEGTIFALIFGGARLPRLAVNFTAFAALQWVAFFTARRLWGRSAYGYALLGLILAQNSLWFFAGGLFDFRMDFPAYCLFGIWACTVLRSGLFLERRWVVAAALVGTLLTLNRYICLIYMLGALGLFGIVLLGIWIIGRRGHSELARRRVGNLILGAVVLLALTLPALFFNRQMIWNYYVVGHVTSGEKYIRMRQTGIVNKVTYLLYYPKSVALDHLGLSFARAALVGLIVSAVLWILSRRPASRAAVAARPAWSPNPWLLQTVFLICAILAPLAALTSDVSKSPVVASIVGIPIALLVVQIMAALTENLAADLSAVLTAAAAFMFVVGGYTILDKASTHGRAFIDHDSIQRLVKASDWMVQFSIDHNWQTPTISCDTISGWYNNGTLNCLAYEHDATVIDFQLRLGNVIDEISRAKAMAYLADSDFTILSDPYRISGYPFTEGIAKYWPDLKAWCDQNMLKIDAISFFGQILHLYVRPTAVVDGLIGTWVPARGIDLRVPADALSRFPIITISGLANPTVVEDASATEQTSRGTTPLPSKMTFDGQNYELRIDASSIDTKLITDSTRIHIDFALNVPAVPDQGIMPQPDRVALVRQGP